MPGVPALARFRKLVDEISRLYIDARGVQVRFGWETGRRIVEEEQNGSLRAAYGSALIPQLSKILTEKYGHGFSESNLRKMRHFYLLHPKQSAPTELDWSDYVELLPAGSGVVVKSHKSKTDIHGRFVTDVFFRQGVEDARDILKDSAYLNQELLEGGHAVRMAE